MNKVVESETKPLLLRDYINGLKTLGFEDDQIKGMIWSLLKRGLITIEPTESIVKFNRYKF